MVVSTVSTSSTKFHAPRPPAAVVERRNLLESLHKHIDSKLLLVTAGPGYGKSTLLAQFADEADFSCVLGFPELVGQEFRHLHRRPYDVFETAV